LLVSPPIGLSNRFIRPGDLLLDDSAEGFEANDNNALDLMAFLDEPQESEAGDESHVN
jgi:hypothetical protein